MNPNIQKTYAVISGNKFMEMGIRLGKELGIFHHLFERKSCNIETLAQLTKTKKSYLQELVHSYIASGLLGFENNEVFIPDRKAFKDMFITPELKYYSQLEVVAPTLKECFSVDGPPGYGHDEAPYVLDHILSTRSFFNIAIAKELSEVIKKYAEKYADVLDLGCGTGSLTIPLTTELNGPKVHGCDFSQNAISRAKSASFGVKNLDLSIQDINELPEAWTEKFDVILLYDVLHDLQFPDKAMKQVMRVLKKGGIAIIVDPLVSSIMSENKGNMMAAEVLTMSTFWCIPSTSCNHGSGNGAGWGWQNKEEFLTGIDGLTILSRLCLIKSNYNYAYICKKK